MLAAKDKSSEQFLKIKLIRILASKWQQVSYLNQCLDCTSHNSNQEETETSKHAYINKTIREHSFHSLLSLSLLT